MLLLLCCNLITGLLGLLWPKIIFRMECAWVNNSSNDKNSNYENSKLQKIENKNLNFQKRIGFGASSQVFLAIWQKQLVAVKTIEKDDNLKEAEILSRLNHPNIIHFWGISQYGDVSIFLVAHIRLIAKLKICREMQLFWSIAKMNLYTNSITNIHLMPKEILQLLWILLSVSTICMKTRLYTGKFKTKKIL